MMVSVPRMMTGRPRGTFEPDIGDGGPAQSTIAQMFTGGAAAASPASINRMAGIFFSETPRPFMARATRGSHHQ